MFKGFKGLSKSPTNPQASRKGKAYDVAELFEGPIGLPSGDGGEGLALDEKLRQAYFWIVNHAIISSHYDVEFNTASPRQFTVGDGQSSLTLPTAQSYSSYALLPLLTFATRSKCLFVGGPGRGKTASAILMGVLAGYPVKSIRRAMQHGQPQMTIADLLGNPLPADLVSAQSMDDIRIAWRDWLGMRVKIIDEYNRIPTRTQSALLTVMGDNYAEILNQVFECPDAAWYLTANSDQGGGTYQVIEALRDRIDVTVQALSFNPRFLGELLLRIEENVRPEELVPREIIFTEDEIDLAVERIRDVTVPESVRRRIEFFSSQFEMMQSAGDQFEYMTKDTARLSGLDWNRIITADSGRDRLKDVGCQTTNGLSVRNLMSVLKFSKALAWFRGAQEVELEDVRQIMPFVLKDKLLPDLEAPFFELPENAVFRVDSISWLRRLFDLANEEYNRLGLDKNDPVGELAAEFEAGLDGLSARIVRGRLVTIEKLIAKQSGGKKLYGHLYDDLLKLKYLHQRYTNYLIWVQSK